MLIPKIELVFYQTPLAQPITVPFEAREVRKKVIRINYVNYFEMNDSVETLINTGTIILPKNKLWVGLTTYVIDYPPQFINYEESFKKLTNIGITNEDGALTYNLINDFNPEIPFTNKEPIFKIGDLVEVRCSYYDPITGKPYSDLKYRKYTRFFVITDLKLHDQLEISIASLSWFYKQVTIINAQLKKNFNLIDLIVTGNNVAALKFPFQLKKGVNNDEMRINLMKSDELTFDDKVVVTGNQSFAQFLDMLKKDYRLNAYMINELLVFPRLIQLDRRVSDNYLTEEMKSYANKLGIEHGKIFCFQNNIITSDLEYKSKTALKLTAIVNNTFLSTTGEVTKDGHKKTKRKKLSVYIEYTQENNKILEDANFFTRKLTPLELTTVIKNLKGIKILSNYDKAGNKITQATGGKYPDLKTEDTDGERRTFTFYEAKDIDTLIRLGLEELQKFFYEGYRGSFTTFGEPTVLLTDIITIVDKEKPERSGYYRVKEVQTSFGMDGYRQEITLDMRLQGDIPINSIKLL